MNNKELQDEYNKIYSRGKDKFFSKFENGKDISETKEVVWSATEWNEKTVLDIGCGTGEIITGIKDRGASSVIGIDYAESAIEIAKNNFHRSGIEFLNQSLDDISIESLNSKVGMDVVISLGTIEHMDRPDLALKKDAIFVKG
jgi:2-polyprenyl-3-methyl-5-hydroxy-6-metoxy-1,4-benzoquinol methylase